MSYGHRDVCNLEGGQRVEATAGDGRVTSRFDVGQTVRHRDYGPGTVVDRVGNDITVVFEGHGYRTLDSTLVGDEVLS